MIKAQNLTIEYSSLLFKSLSFTLGNNEKVALIGLNGSGKSTLLKIIAGIEQPDSGMVEISKHEVLQYLPQEFELTIPGYDTKDRSSGLLGEYLESLVDYDISQVYRVNIILQKLELGEIDIFQKLETLSPGQKMKLYLAKLLINNPTILLMDEPTNHLDIDGILWLERFIQDFDGICIIVSHDRSFLNNCVDTVFEIDEQKLYVWEGHYDDYLDQKEEFKFEREKQLKAQEEKRAQMERLLENARKIAGGKKRGKAVRAAKKRMEREVLRNEISGYEEKRVKDFSMQGSVHDKKRILEVKDLTFGYEAAMPDGRQDKKIINNLDLSIYGKERLWLYGPNGIGKSTLIKLLIGELEPNNGLINWGENLKWDYFAQDHTNIPLNKTVEEYFRDSTNVDYGKVFGLMDSFLFDKSLRNKKIEKLSPGQRARLTFAVFSQHNYDCLILDEPTNHIDINTKEVIEEALKSYKGVIILISHDRYFAENIMPTRVLSLEGGKLVQLS